MYMLCNNDTSDRIYRNREQQNNGMLVRIDVLVLRIRTPMPKYQKYPTNTVQRETEKITMAYELFTGHKGYRIREIHERTIFRTTIQSVAHYKV
jgi:hypothetical protein